MADTCLKQGTLRKLPMTTTHGNPTTSANVVDVSAPGAIPYVELSATNFGEILSLTESITSQGWVVTTPAGPMVLGYKQIKSILRNPMDITTFKLLCIRPNGKWHFRSERDA